MISKDTKYVKKNFGKWNKKQEINIGNNRLYKIIGSGPKAFKVLKFMPQEETTKPAWNQTWWKYDELTEIGEAVISVIANSLKTSPKNSQTTLDSE